MAEGASVAGLTSSLSEELAGNMGGICREISMSGIKTRNKQPEGNAKAVRKGAVHQPDGDEPGGFRAVLRRGAEGEMMRRDCDRRGHGLLGGLRGPSNL